MFWVACLIAVALVMMALRGVFVRPLLCFTLVVGEGAAWTLGQRIRVNGKRRLIGLSGLACALVGASGLPAAS